MNEKLLEYGWLTYTCISKHVMVDCLSDYTLIPNKKERKYQEIESYCTKRDREREWGLNANGP